MPAKAKFRADGLPRITPAHERLMSSANDKIAWSFTKIFVVVLGLVAAIAFEPHFTRLHAVDPSPKLLDRIRQFAEQSVNVLPVVADGSPTEIAKARSHAQKFRTHVMSACDRQAAWSTQKTHLANCFRRVVEGDQPKLSLLKDACNDARNAHQAYIKATGDASEHSSSLASALRELKELHAQFKSDETPSLWLLSKGGIFKTWRKKFLDNMQELGRPTDRFIADLSRTRQDLATVVEVAHAQETALDAFCREAKEADRLLNAAIPTSEDQKRKSVLEDMARSWKNLTGQLYMREYMSTAFNLS